MIETFQPAQVADMNHTTNAWRKFNKHTVWCNVLHQTIVFASLRETGFNCAPWIFAELFDGQAHLARVFIERYDTSLVFITQFEKFFCIDWRIRPCDFTDVNQTFHTRHNFEESAVVFNVYYFTLHDFAFFDVFRQHIPRMRSQLLQSETDTFFAIVEIEYHHLELLIQFEYFARMTDTPPADIGDI